MSEYVRFLLGIILFFQCGLGDETGREEKREKEESECEDLQEGTGLILAARRRCIMAFTIDCLDQGKIDECLRTPSASLGWQAGSTAGFWYK